MRRSKKWPEIERLFKGDLSDCDGNKSRADFRLCCRLAFYLGPDANRINRMFCTSKLMREKWDERRCARTDGERTMLEALIRTTQC